MSMTPEQVQAEIAKAVEAATTPLTQQIAALTTKLAATPPAPTQPEPPPKKYTRAEITKAVDDGHISQEQADALWDAQQAREVKEAIDSRVDQELTARQLKATIERDIGDYSEIAPNAFVAGTPEHTKVKKQYDYLVSIGQPATKATELTALNLALGSLDALKAASRVKQPRETHEDEGGDGEPPVDSSASDKLQKLKIPARLKAHYKALVDKGIMTPEAVDAELKHYDNSVHARRKPRAA